MKENVTLSDLKAGDKLICTNLEYIQRFKVGKEYEVKEGEFGLFIENEHKVPIYIELNIKAFSECFSLLTPQQPERLLSEADLVKDAEFECIEESVFQVSEDDNVNDTIVFFKGEKYCVKELGTIHCSGHNFFIEDKKRFNDFLNRHFKLISQTAQEEVKEETETLEKAYSRLTEAYFEALKNNTELGQLATDSLNKVAELESQTSLLQQEVEKLRKATRVLLKESTSLYDYFIDLGYLDSENLSEGQELFNAAVENARQLIHK